MLKCEWGRVNEQLHRRSEEEHWMSLKIELTVMPGLDLCSGIMTYGRIEWHTRLSY